MGDLVIATALFLAVNIGGFFDAIITPLGERGVSLMVSLQSTSDSIGDILASLSQNRDLGLYDAFERLANFSTDVWATFDTLLFSGVNIPIINEEIALYDLLTSVTVPFGVDPAEMSLLACAFLFGVIFLLLTALFSLILGYVKLVFEVIGILG